MTVRGSRSPKAKPVGFGEINMMVGDMKVVGPGLDEIQ